MFGRLGEGANLSTCFLEKKGVESSQPTVRVWTKCLRKSDFEAFDWDHEPGSRLVYESIARGTSYVPPAVALGEAPKKDTGIITTYEAVANADLFKPQARLLWELNCEATTSRFLSITFFEKDGPTKSHQQPTEWEHIAPESNANMIYRIVCSGKLQ